MQSGQGKQGIDPGRSWSQEDLLPEEAASGRQEDPAVHEKVAPQTAERAGNCFGCRKREGPCHSVGHGVPAKLSAGFAGAAAAAAAASMVGYYHGGWGGAPVPPMNKS